jgi:uncharacterized membrane protein YesL
VLWAAVLGLYEAPLTFVRGNLAWLGLNLPLFAATSYLLDSVHSSSGADALSPWSFVTAAWLVFLLPGPAIFGLGDLARVSSLGETPRFPGFWPTVQREWRRGLVAYLVGAGGMVALIVNVVFYAAFSQGILRLLTFLWLWVALIWLSVNLLLVPLTLHLPNLGLLATYRRALVLVMAYPKFWLVLLVAILLASVLAIVLMPLYLLVGGALLSLVQAHAFRSLRLTLGDLTEEVRR